MIAANKEEIAILTEAGGLLHTILMKVIERVAIGVTGKDLDIYAEQLIRDAGGKPAFKGYGNPPYPATLCVSINSCVVHGIPTDTPLINGDLVGLDIGMVYKGFYTDMARTVAVGKVSKHEEHLMHTAREALDAALAMIRPGITTGDIGFLIQSYVEKRGFGIVRDLAGHGVGKALHESPEIPNFGKKGKGDKLEAGMVLAIEPMITLGSWEVTIADDNWSIMTADGSKSAHSEDMVLVTETGHEVLTQ
jgi:methionyl aminopeptidase